MCDGLQVCVGGCEGERPLPYPDFLTQAIFYEDDERIPAVVLDINHPVVEVVLWVPAGLHRPPDRADGTILEDFFAVRAIISKLPRPEGRGFL